jgi:hypothetical protein
MSCEVSKSQLNILGLSLDVSHIGPSGNTIHVDLLEYEDRFVLLCCEECLY